MFTFLIISSKCPLSHVPPEFWFSVAEDVPEMPILSLLVEIKTLFIRMVCGKVPALLRLHFS